LNAVFVFAAALLLAVLIPERASRGVLSTAVLFLVTGFVMSQGMFGVVVLSPQDPVVAVLAELALFSVLFTDGMRTGAKELSSAWRLPGRALLLGLPLTLVFTAMLAHWVAGLPWLESFLIGAVLSPTDPVLAAATVSRQEVPRRLRQLLNVESGLNDGLALPIVIVLLTVAGSTELKLGTLASELTLGVGLGVFIPWLAIRLERNRHLGAIWLMPRCMRLPSGFWYCPSHRSFTPTSSLPHSQLASPWPQSATRFGKRSIGLASWWQNY